MIDLNALAAEIHANAVEKGFWDVEDAEEKAFACMHCELSEAIQEDRIGNPMIYVDDIEYRKLETDIDCFEGRKPEGVAVELADFVMRLLDWAAMKELELEWRKFKLDYDRITRSSLTEIVLSGHSMVIDLWGNYCDRATNVSCIISGIYEWLKYRGYDLFMIIRLKMTYNKNRPALHGRKY